MIARLGPEYILNQHGRHILLSASHSHMCKSWFIAARSICNKYNLPDPLLVLQSPSTPSKWKRLCKSKVIDWWEHRLRGEADILPSLEFFKTRYMSLSSPHPIWLSAGSPYEVGKAVVAARMLSGRYPTDLLSKHWTYDNPEGFCRLPGCLNLVGNLGHYTPSLLCPV